MTQTELVLQVASILDSKGTPLLKVRDAIKEILKGNRQLDDAYDKLFGSTIPALDSFVRQVADSRKEGKCSRPSPTRAKSSA